MKKNLFIKYLLICLSGFCAGIFIGLGGFANIVSLSNNLKFIGALLFSIGLFLVCGLSCHLYTGQIGFVVKNYHKLIWLDLILMLVFNLLGAYVLGVILKLTIQSNESVLLAIDNIVNARIGDVSSNWYKSLILSFTCGVFVFLAVYFYKLFDNYFAKIFSLIFCVTVFVFIGAEHCIANMFYFAIANNVDTLSCFYNLLITIIGNSIGALATYFAIQGILKIKTISENK